MTRIDVIKHIKLLEALCTSLLISSDMAKHCGPVGSASNVWYLWHLQYLLNYKKIDEMGPITLNTVCSTNPGNRLF